MPVTFTTTLPSPTLDSIDTSVEDQLTISWTKNDDNTTGNYEIYRSQDGTLGSLVTTITNLSTTSYTDTGLEDGEQYYYTVRRNTDDASADSNQDNGTTILPAPSSVSLDSSVEDEITVSWTNNDDSSDGTIEVYRSQDGTLGSQVLSTTTLSTTSYTDTGLEDGEQYYYTVRRSTDHFTSDSGQVSATTVLPSPSNASLDASVEDEITVSWTNNDDSSDGSIDVYRSQDGTLGTSVFSTTTLSTTSYTDTGLEDGEQYYYTVRRSTDHTSSDSSQHSATTVLPAPSSLSSSYSGGSIDLSWTNNDDSTDGGIGVERSSDGGSTWTDIATSLSPSTTSYSDTTVTVGESYTYRIERNTDHSTSTSGTTTQQTLTAPTNLSVSSNTVDEVDLTWDDVNGEDGYYVYRALSSGSTTGDYNQVASLGANTTSYTDTGLSDSEQYYYRVASYVGSTEKLSNEDSAITIINAVVSASSASAASTTETTASTEAPINTTSISTAEQSNEAASSYDIPSTSSSAGSVASTTDIASASEVSAISTSVGSPLQPDALTSSTEAPAKTPSLGSVRSTDETSTTLGRATLSANGTSSLVTSGTSSSKESATIIGTSTVTEGKSTASISTTSATDEPITSVSTGTTTDVITSLRESPLLSHSVSTSVPSISDSTASDEASIESGQTSVPTSTSTSTAIEEDIITPSAATIFSTNELSETQEEAVLSISSDARQASPTLFETTEEIQILGERTTASGIDIVPDATATSFESPPALTTFTWSLVDDTSEGIAKSGASISSSEYDWMMSDEVATILGGASITQNTATLFTSADSGFATDSPTPVASVGSSIVPTTLSETFDSPSPTKSSSTITTSSELSGIFGGAILSVASGSSETTVSTSASKESATIAAATTTVEGNAGASQETASADDSATATTSVSAIEPTVSTSSTTDAPGLETSTGTSQGVVDNSSSTDASVSTLTASASLTMDEFSSAFDESVITQPTTIPLSTTLSLVIQTDNTVAVGSPRVSISDGQKTLDGVVTSSTASSRTLGRVAFAKPDTQVVAVTASSIVTVEDLRSITVRRSRTGGSGATTNANDFGGVDLSDNVDNSADTN